MTPDQAQVFITIYDIITMIIAIVALSITIIGFFASLKFYRDGVKLQGLANDALVKIEEKTNSIQTQVGGMFDKVLDAAIQRSQELTQNFDEINTQLEASKQNIVNEALSQIGKVGENERNKLLEIVNQQISEIKNYVEAAKENAELIVRKSGTVEAVPTKDKIISFLNTKEGWVHSKDISTYLNFPRVRTVVLLRNLVDKGILERKETETGAFYKIKNV